LKSLSISYKGRYSPGEEALHVSCLELKVIVSDSEEGRWEKKVVKIHKAMTLMEKAKYLEPHFSISF